MKILLIGNYAPDRQESMQRFALLVQRELQALGHDVKLIQPQPKINRSGAGPSGKAKWLGYIDKYLLFPFFLKKAAKWAEVVHICDHSNAPYVRLLKHKPHLVTCHDVLAINSALGHVPQNKTGFTGRVLQRYILNGLNQAAHVACVSIKTKQELLGVSNLKENQVSVVYNSLNYNYSPMNTDEASQRIHDLISEKLDQRATMPPFVFHIGGNQWYKNRLGVIRIFDKVRQSAKSQDLILIMAGKQFTPEMKEEVAGRKLEDLVFEVNDASNEDVRALYSMAQLLLFPSLAEGFGWPIIEAQACGCRVVTSNFAPMTEVGGDCAIYCNPEIEDEAADIVSSVIDEEEDMRNARIQAGLERAKLFSPEFMTKAYIGLYEQIK